MFFVLSRTGRNREWRTPGGVLKLRSRGLVAEFAKNSVSKQLEKPTRRRTKTSRENRLTKMVRTLVNSATTAPGQLKEVCASFLLTDSSQWLS